MTAFHTPMRPVWLVAMSWFPTKNKASTGTPKWKTPAEEKEDFSREENGSRDTRCQKIPLGHGIFTG